MKKLINVFIPIRKNSKRIKNKSIRSIGKYKLGLTEIKILQIKKMLSKVKKDKVLKKYEFKIIISTDCKKIKKFAKNFKWILIHNRPKKLAMDDCLQELILEVPKICPDGLIFWTHVTSPMFNSDNYIESMKKFILNSEKKNYDSLVTVDSNNQYLVNSKNKWISHNPKIKKWPRTQDLKNIYHVNSAAFISTRKLYLKYRDRIGIKPYFYQSKKLSGYDIDSQSHFDYYKSYLLK